MKEVEAKMGKGGDGSGRTKGGERKNKKKTR